MCTNRKKLFCFYCRYAVKHNWLTFCKTREDVFTEKGFQNWKKAIDKFRAHEGSLSHKDAKMKLMAKESLLLGVN